MTTNKVKSSPIELILKQQVESDEKIQASYERLFLLGSQYYVAIRKLKENTVFLLKVVQDSDNYVLSNIASEHEFASVLEHYQSLVRNPII